MINKSRVQIFVFSGSLCLCDGSDTNCPDLLISCLSGAVEEQRFCARHSKCMTHAPNPVAFMSEHS